MTILVVTDQSDAVAASGTDLRRDSRLLVVDDDNEVLDVSLAYLLIFFVVVWLLNRALECEMRSRCT